MYNYIIRLWCYLALPFYFLYIDYLKPNKKMINFVFIINLLITLVFTLLSFTKYRYAGYENYIGTDSAWLTLGYDNPNQTAMYLLITLIILYCAMNYYTNKLIRVLILLDIIYMGTLLIDTSSRTCILIAVFITVIILLKKKYTVPRYIVIGILLLPGIFLLAYPYLYENGFIYVLEFGGKVDYSSRSYIFLSVLTSIKDRLLLGDFGTYQLQNLHNGTLSVLSSLGIIGLLFSYIYFFRAYYKILSNKIKSKTAYISFIGLLAIFIHACTEGAFIIGGSMYAGTLSVLIFLVKLDWKELKNI
ncbi:MAG: O-antigen ligase family protein [Mobilitalea sp.]